MTPPPFVRRFGAHEASKRHENAVVAWAPGRVNLIGDHTDYAGGLALPLAVDLGTTVSGVHRDGPPGVTLRSAAEREPAVVGPGATGAPRGWARHVAGVVHELGRVPAFDGAVESTLPIGAGLSSSTSLSMGLALALGFQGTLRELAELCRRAERRATGVPCGLLDQLAIAFGRRGHALVIDFTHVTVDPVPVPDEAQLVVVHSGETRTVSGSPYAERVAACETAAAGIGPLHDALPADVAAVGDPLVRRRARHVVTENARVREAAEALRAGDLPGLGALMDASHASLRDDYEVSTPALDALVAHLKAQPGVHGARLTGAGFGGCAIALAEPAARIVDRLPAGRSSWVVQPCDGARCVGVGDRRP